MTRKTRAKRTPTRFFQIRIPVDLHEWLQNYAFETDTTMTEIVTTYVRKLRSRKERPLEVPEV